MSRRQMAWLALSSGLVWAVAPAAAQLANTSTTVVFNIEEYINLDYTDPLIEFANLAPELEGWVVATHPTGALDTATVLVTSNFPYQLTWEAGAPLTFGDRSLPTEIATQLKGRGVLDGTTFDTVGVWPGTWSPWQPTSEGSPARGLVYFESGSQFGLQAQARLFRSGLLDPPGTYTQPVPMRVVVGSR